MLKMLSPVCLFLLCALCASAQSFDVATIYPHPAGDDRFGVKTPAEGQFRATGATAKQLLMLAFDMQEAQIVGGPEWLGSAKWDVEAKSTTAAHTVEETRRMLQNMLQERFALRVHQGTVQRPAYVLIVAKGGPKFKVATEGTTNVRIAPNSIRVERGEIGRMAQVLSTALARPVVDRTGLTEVYDFTLQWEDAPRNQGAAAGTDSGSIFTAMQEQLGLQLLAQPVTVDVITIDGIERPSQN